MWEGRERTLEHKHHCCKPYPDLEFEWLSLSQVIAWRSSVAYLWQTREHIERKWCDGKGKGMPRETKWMDRQFPPSQKLGSLPCRLITEVDILPNANNRRISYILLTAFTDGTQRHGVQRNLRSLPSYFQTPPLTWDTEANMSNPAPFATQFVFFNLNFRAIGNYVLFSNSILWLLETKNWYYNITSIKLKSFS